MLSQNLGLLEALYVNEIKLDCMQCQLNLSADLIRRDEVPAGTYA